MKITIDRKSITLDELESAKEIKESYKPYRDDDIEVLASRVLRQYGKRDFHLLKTDEAKVTKNHFQLTVWARVYMERFNEIAIVNFDLPQSESVENVEIDNYTTFFKELHK
jgi:hypothetical protein